jgi:uncharacterized membrane protein
MEILPLPPGITKGQATAISNDGRMAGSAFSGDWVDDDLQEKGALFWSASGTLVQISDAGAAATVNTGAAVTGEIHNRPFSWSFEGGFGPAPSLPTEVYYAGATGMNSDGTMVGNIVPTAGGPQHGFIWSVDGGLREVYPPAGRRSLTFTGINSSGQIVGYVE